MPRRKINRWHEQTDFWKQQLDLLGFSGVEVVIETKETSYRTFAYRGECTCGNTFGNFSVYDFQKECYGAELFICKKCGRKYTHHRLEKTYDRKEKDWNPGWIMKERTGEIVEDPFIKDDFKFPIQEF